jgi:hypothetical protein
MSDPVTEVKAKGILSTNTLVPLGFVVAMIVLAFNAQRYLDAKFLGMQQRIDGTQKQIFDLTYTLNTQLSTIRGMMNNRWTAQDMRIWEQELKINNPSLTIPDSTKITRSRAVPGELR